MRDVRRQDGIFKLASPLKNTFFCQCLPRRHPHSFFGDNQKHGVPGCCSEHPLCLDSLQNASVVLMAICKL